MRFCILLLLTLAIACDVSQADSAQAAVRQATQHFGGLDVLVNNAGTDVTIDLAQQNTSSLITSREATASTELAKAEENPSLLATIAGSIGSEVPPQGRENTGCMKCGEVIWKEAWAACSFSLPSHR